MQALLAVSIFLGRFDQVLGLAQHLPVIASAAGIVLLLISILSFALYRGLHSESVLDTFQRAGSSATQRHIYWATILWMVPVVLAAALSFYEQKKRVIEKEKSIQEQFKFGLVNQVSLSTDGKSLYVASKGSSPRIVAINLTSGKAIAKDFPDYSIYGEINQLIVPDRLPSMLSESHRYFYSRHGIGLIDTLTNKRVVPIAGEIVPLGFKENGRYFLYLRPPPQQGGTVEMIELATGQIIYSTPVSYSQSIAKAVSHGVFSRLRDKYAFLFGGSVYVLDTTSGALRKYGQGLESNRLTFSIEGDAILVNEETWKKGAQVSAGLLIDLRDDKLVSHFLSGKVLYFSTAADLVVHIDGEGAEAYAFADFPKTKKWRVDPQADAYPVIASNDGRYLLFRKRDDNVRNLYRYVDLRPMQSGGAVDFQPIELMSKASSVETLHVSSEHNYLIFYSSPYLEILRTDFPEGGPKSVFAVNLAEKFLKDEVKILCTWCNDR
jgi:hypothetical protein